MNKQLRILHVEDSEQDVELLSHHLSRAGYSLSSMRVETPEAMTAALASEHWDVILCDYSMPHFNAIDAIDLLKSTKLDIPFIIVSGTIGEAAAIEGMRAGAHDYLMKDNLGRLAPTIERELQEADNRRRRRKAEEERAQLAAIVESSEDAILSKTMNGRITSWNAAAERMYGYTREEAIGRHITFILPSEHFQELAEVIEKIKRGESVRHLETVRIRKDGARLAISLSVSPIKDSEGRIVGASTIGRDITERKRAEQALRESEERYRSLVLTTSQLVWTTDANGAVTNVTNTVTGLGEEVDLSGWKWVDTIHPDDRDRLVREWTDAVQTASRFESEYRQRHADGTYHYWTARGIPIRNKDGSVREWIGTSDDITKRRLAEDSLQMKNDELAAITQQFWQASRLAVMGELAASIAHELNNPLATVSLRAESLLEQVSEGDAKRRSLEVIAQEVDRMGGLVSNLLQFSRRSHQQISTFDVRQEIDNTLEFIHYHLRKHQIGVEREFAESLPTVQADRQQLRQLFLNLLTNASDATLPGGLITVRVTGGRMESGARAVVIEFSDTGAGISPEDLSKVWEPFFTTKPEGRGTGLGLAICRRIVEEHRGTISITSERGKGSTVQITLPATNGEEAL